MNDTLILNWSGPEEAPEHEMRSRAQRDSVDGFMQLFLAMLNLRVVKQTKTHIIEIKNKHPVTYIRDIKHTLSHS